MTKALHISDHVTLPLELAARTTAILAQKGAGKTYAAMRITEELLTHDQQVVAAAQPLSGPLGGTENQRTGAAVVVGKREGGSGVSVGETFLAEKRAGAGDPLSTTAGSRVSVARRMDGKRKREEGSAS